MPIRNESLNLSHYKSIGTDTPERKGKKRASAPYRRGFQPAVRL